MKSTRHPSEWGSPRDDSESSSDASLLVGSWECPICGQTGMSMFTEENNTAKPIVALKNHIRTQGWDGHGPKFELPDTEQTTESALEPYVSTEPAPARS